MQTKIETKHWMNLAKTKKKHHNLITFPLNKKTLRILFTIDNTITTTTTNKRKHSIGRLTQANKQTKNNKNLRFGPLSAIDLRKLTSLSLEHNSAGQLVSVATSHTQSMLWRRRHRHSHRFIQRSHKHTTHTHSAAGERKFKCERVQRVCVWVQRPPQLEYCDWNRNENKNNNSSVNTRKKPKKNNVCL